MEHSAVESTDELLDVVAFADGSTLAGADKEASSAFAGHTEVDVRSEVGDPSVVGCLVARIDALVDTDAGVLADEDSLIELSRQLDRLEAVVTRATARFDAEGGYAGSGARSTEANGRVACGFHNRQRNHDSGRERGP